MVAPTPTLTPPPKHHLRPDPRRPKERGHQDAEVITVTTPALQSCQWRAPEVLALGIGDVFESKPKEVAGDALDLATPMAQVAMPKGLTGMGADILRPDQPGDGGAAGREGCADGKTGMHDVARFPGRSLPRGRTQQAAQGQTQNSRQHGRARIDRAALA